MTLSSEEYIKLAESLAELRNSTAVLAERVSPLPAILEQLQVLNSRQAASHERLNAHEQRLSRTETDIAGIRAVMSYKDDRKLDKLWTVLGWIAPSLITGAMMAYVLFKDTGAKP